MQQSSPQQYARRKLFAAVAVGRPGLQQLPLPIGWDCHAVTTYIESTNKIVHGKAEKQDSGN